MRKLFYKLSLMVGFVLLTGHAFLFAQSITTSTLKGVVTGSATSAERKITEGEALPGANIIALHEPSGTTYGSVSNLNGDFTIPNMRVGGPYKVTVSYIGYQDAVYENIYLSLGSTTNININLTEDATQLGEVVITGGRDAIFSSDRTGAATNLSQEKINSLPTINRSINDFTRLTPQSNGTSFAGRDPRFNNYTIDGNIYNNNFGLGNGQFAGSSPISLDAIEEVQVNLAPYDVRQGGFTGANVNAITKSGTNNVSASVYYYFRNDQLIGDKADETRLTNSDAKNTIRGFRVGGPIIKNKLFFFVNYEKEIEDVPSFTKRAARPGLTPDGLTISRVQASELDFVRESMISLYGYDPGEYEGYNFASEGERFNARLDFNINQNHKLAVRYNNYTSFRDVPVNGNSIRFISTRYFNTNRTGIEAMNFRNGNYTIDTNVKSYVAELNSRIGNNLANSFNVGYTSITDPKRGIPGGQTFPFIEVLEQDGGGNLLYYFNMGNELFSVGNLLENNIFNITNNTTYFLGQHTITGGINFERMTFDNAFNPTFNGFYRFNSYQNFVDAVINQDPNVYPDAFAQSYAFDGSTTPPTDQTRFAQLGLYVQDEFQFTDRLKFTAGLRVDLPFYPIDLPKNETLDALDKEFTNPLTDETFTPDVSVLPRIRPLWSPRIGFNYDVMGDKTTQLRGGTGVFSGRIPFVWLSNQVNGNGVIRGGIGYEGQEVIDNNILFTDDVNAYRPDPSTLTAQLSNELNLTDRDFKLPQTWRTNLAIDQKLPFGITATLEFMYNRDLSTPIAVNPVLADPDGTLAGADKRPYWTGADPISTDPDFRNIFLLTNAKDQGDYYSLSAQVQKSFDNGLFLSLAYTRSRARDLGMTDGSQAISLWSQVVSENRNQPERSFARFDQPNRVVGLVSYEINKTTTLSLFYDGGEAGRYSYTYSGNFGDGSQRLMYVPNAPSEIIFQDYAVNGETITAQQQSDAFFAFVEQDEYLSGMKGKVTERFGAVRPWLHRFDFRLSQDIPVIKVKDNVGKFQLTFDILNVGNLINPEWGVAKTAVQTNLLNYRGVDGAGNPIFRMNLQSGTTELPTESFRPITDFGQVWRGQIGIRFLFN